MKVLTYINVSTTSVSFSELDRSSSILTLLLNDYKELNTESATSLEYVFKTLATAGGNIGILPAVANNLLDSISSFISLSKITTTTSSIVTKSLLNINNLNETTTDPKPVPFSLADTLNSIHFGLSKRKIIGENDTVISKSGITLVNGKLGISTVESRTLSINGNNINVGRQFLRGPEEVNPHYTLITTYESTNKSSTSIIDVKYYDNNLSPITTNSESYIEIEFVSSRNLSDIKNETYVGGLIPVCKYYNESTSKWDSTGCYVSKWNITSVTCRCNHLTTFATFLDWKFPLPIPPSYAPVMSVTVVIASAIYVIGLIAFSIIELINAKAFNAEQEEARLKKQGTYRFFLEELLQSHLWISTIYNPRRAKSYTKYQRLTVLYTTVAIIFAASSLIYGQSQYLSVNPFLAAFVVLLISFPIPTIISELFVRVKPYEFQKKFTDIRKTPVDAFGEVKQVAIEDMDEATKRKFNLEEKRKERLRKEKATGVSTLLDKLEGISSIGDKKLDELKSKVVGTYGQLALIGIMFISFVVYSIGIILMSLILGFALKVRGWIIAFYVLISLAVYFDFVLVYYTSMKVKKYLLKESKWSYSKIALIISIASIVVFAIISVIFFFLSIFDGPNTPVHVTIMSFSILYFVMSVAWLISFFLDKFILKRFDVAVFKVELPWWTIIPLMFLSIVASVAICITLFFVGLNWENSPSFSWLYCVLIAILFDFILSKPLSFFFRLFVVITLSRYLEIGLEKEEKVKKSQNQDSDEEDIEEDQFDKEKPKPKSDPETLKKLHLETQEKLRKEEDGEVNEDHDPNDESYVKEVEDAKGLKEDIKKLELELVNKKDKKDEIKKEEIIKLEEKNEENLLYEPNQVEEIKEEETKKEEINEFGNLIITKYYSIHSKGILLPL